MIDLLTVFWKGMILHLWQVTLFLGILFLLEKCLRKAPARVTNTLWQIGLIRLFLPVSLIKAAASSLTQLTGTGGGVIETITIPGAAALETMANPATVIQGIDRGSSLLPGAVFAGITIIWTATVLTFLVRMLFDLRRSSIGPAARLGSLIDDEAMKLRIICEDCGISADHVLLTDKRLMPGVTGVFKPKIVVPRDLIISLGDEELTAVLIHEENHRQRKDPLRSLAARLGLALFHFYPLIYPVLRRLHATAEYACDEVALSSGISPRTYARAFTRTLRIGLAYGGAHYAAAGRDGSLLKKRLRRMFEPRRYKMTFASRSIIAIAVFALVAGFLFPMPSAAEGENIPPKLIKSVEPEYPKECLKAGYESKIILAVLIDKDGSVKKAKVVDPATFDTEDKKSEEKAKPDNAELHKALEKAALLAAYQWKFEPATKDGKPVEMEVKVPIAFNLD